MAVAGDWRWWPDGAVGGGGLADPCWHGEEQGHGGREAGVVPICLLGGPLLRMVVDPPLVTRI